ncbi:hypothetical protein I7V28_19200 [Lelliottia amnigena]|uniref:hypothetical protein n=1 Tax=Lelliottia TaxID=1330545 RepID=UPI00192BCEAA|nr:MULTISPECIES: hypothetical protein [Lelliottia]MBL5885632.1 hypothetical protein [Lelliottia aquatilis]MBL5923210.1 hypothetical protein [Lelliottia amnigena]MBL5932120.1 hypothetical protein [Lelliottia amnigena]
MKSYFTPLVRGVLFLCLLLLGLRIFSTATDAVSDPVFYSLVVLFIVLGTLVARAAEGKKPANDTAES